MRKLFMAAFRGYLEKRGSRKLLAALNRAYATAEMTEERTVRQKSKKRYHRISMKERS